MYVRKKAKGFGRNAQIEGDLSHRRRQQGQFLQCAAHGGRAGRLLFVMFDYDIFPQSAGHLKNLNVKLHHLTRWWNVLEVAEEDEIFDAGALKDVCAFLAGPSQWSGAHGGISDFAASS